MQKGYISSSNFLEAALYIARHLSNSLHTTKWTISF